MYGDTIGPGIADLNSRIVNVMSNTYQSFELKVSFCMNSYYLSDNIGVNTNSDIVINSIREVKPLNKKLHHDLVKRKSP